MSAQVTSSGSERSGPDRPWTAGAEVPDADAQEQQQPLVDDPDAGDPEAMAGRTGGPPSRDLPIAAADEGDLAEQALDLGYEDDEDGRG